MSEPSHSTLDAEKMAHTADYLAQGGTLAEINNISQEVLETTYELAYQQYSSGHYMEAAKRFRYLCFYNQWNPKFFISLGACQQMMKVYGQAIDTFTYAARLDPNNPLPVVYIGDCYNAIKQNENAMTAYRAAIKLAKMQLFSHSEITRAESFLAALETYKKESN